MTTIPPPPTGPRRHTLSIALPASVLAGLPTLEQRTLLGNRIARAACVYHVDEVVVYDDGLLSAGNAAGAKRYMDEMISFLQYSECPQYLRKTFFPLQNKNGTLAKAAWCHPVDAPHHCREGERSLFREGAVTEKTARRNGKQVSMAHCGIRGCLVTLDRLLEKDVRVTVRIEDAEYDKVWGREDVPSGPKRGRGASSIAGAAVAPSAPRDYDGRYWGYEVRRAESFPEAMAGCPYGESYDLTIGTSERGTSSVDAKEGFGLPSFRNCLLVFGGQAGIEEVVDAIETSDDGQGNNDDGGWREKNGSMSRDRMWEIV
uniref:Uncharacterized protein n=1 Tax=Corethron hystrix TaxID=216773 RepID=A0A7S1B3H1_9STRA|mmetsp:Transcript_11384/g.24987  ORF Transcript_11384/g.24987 Transcript_11384/m.24987 type:complete len:316 (+) Transcript_11384:1-948(+)